MKLIDYLPEFLRRYREYRYIFDYGDQPEITRVESSAEDLYNNMLVLSANEEGIRRYEKMLHISPAVGAEIEERRFTILAILNTQLPYSERKLQEILINLCGSDGFVLKVDPGKYSVNVRVALKNKNMRDAVSDLLERILPANLVYDVRTMYNQWLTYKDKKWSDSKALTWAEMKTHDWTKEAAASE